jgi:hypothetical protein
VDRRRSPGGSEVPLRSFQHEIPRRQDRLDTEGPEGALPDEEE